MWSYEHTIVTDTSPESIWVHYANVSEWTKWDKDLLESRLNGPFKKGTAGSLTSKFQESIPFVLKEVIINEYFSNLTKFHDAGIEIEFSHCLGRVKEGTKITHGFKITGINADTVGREMVSYISKGIPDTMVELVSLARGK